MLYVDQQMSTRQVADKLNCTPARVLAALKRHGPTNIDPRLTALYADPEITRMLRRHRIPRREQPGSITDRFPDPAPTTERFLREAYVEIGLAATHIEQLTGQPAERILGQLHASSMPVRPAGAFSPWYLRNRPQAQGGRPASRRR